MKIEPYLVFEGRCEEALTFYREAVGAEVLMMMRFGESPEPATHLPPGNEQKIMHASFRIGESTIMASDGMCSGEQGPQAFKGFSLSIDADSDADAGRLYAVLAECGEVVQPLIRTFFASSFGMLRDRFGLSWILMVRLPVP